MYLSTKHLKKKIIITISDTTKTEKKAHLIFLRIFSARQRQ
jgi:hypothetical protein